MYLLLKNNQIEKYPYSIDNLKKDNPDTSFPESLSTERLADFGVYSVIPSEAPSVDYTKNVKEVLPIFKDNKWIQAWKIENASESEKTERLDMAWSELRYNRNMLLSNSDWTQLDDTSVNKTAWASYRQDLRNLPQNTTDPFNPIWPQKPE